MRCDDGVDQDADRAGGGIVHRLADGHSLEGGMRDDARDGDLGEGAIHFGEVEALEESWAEGEKGGEEEYDGGAEHWYGIWCVGNVGESRKNAA